MLVQGQLSPHLVSNNKGEGYSAGIRIPITNLDILSALTWRTWRGRGRLKQGGVARSAPRASGGTVEKGFSGSPQSGGGLFPLWPFSPAIILCIRKIICEQRQTDKCTFFSSKSQKEMTPIERFITTKLLTLYF